MTLNNFQLTAHFKLSEFECKCCQRVKLDDRLVSVLEAVRADIGKPVIITSGYRCHTHNRDVQGADDSDHLYGWAADIVVIGMEPNLLKDIVAGHLFSGRIGTYSTLKCVHVSIRSRIGEGYPDRFHITSQSNHGRRA